MFSGLAAVNGSCVITADGARRAGTGLARGPSRLSALISGAQSHSPEAPVHRYPPDKLDELAEHDDFGAGGWGAEMLSHDQAEDSKGWHSDR